MRIVGLDLSTHTGVTVLDDEKIILADELEIHRSTVGMIEAVNGLGIICNGADLVVIEGFSFSSRGNAVDFQYGIGHAMRMELYKSRRPYVIVSPSQLKKFAGTKGNAAKRDVAVAVYKRWGYEHSSDNVLDAFVLAQIGKSIFTPAKVTKEQYDIIVALRGGIVHE